MWRSAVLVAMAVLMALAASSASASIPDSNGVITSCYSTDPAGPFGALRVIDLAQSMSCSAGEQQLTFNQAGPQGAAGPQGQAGPAGPAGPPGPAGDGVAFVHWGWHGSFTE